MKLSVSAYRAHASAHKKILSNSYQSQLNYGSTAPASSSATSTAGLFAMEPSDNISKIPLQNDNTLHTPPSKSDGWNSPGTDCENPGSEENPDVPLPSMETKDAIVNSNLTKCEKHPNPRKSQVADANVDSDSDWNKSNQRWMKLRTTVQISSAIQKKPPLKREDSFLKRFSTRQIPDTQETMEDTGSESASGDAGKSTKRRRRYLQKRRSVVNPDENFYFYWLMLQCTCVLYNLWTLIVRQSFPELQLAVATFWLSCDGLTDLVFILDIIVQLRTGYLEQGLMVYDDKKLAYHYMRSRPFLLDVVALVPLDVLQIKLGYQPLLRFPRFLKVYRAVRFYYIVESRTVWPNLWRVVNLIHILLILAHWFGCFYYLLSEAEGFQGDWVYPYRPGDYATLSRKYLGSLYWSTLTLTTIGDLPTPETNAEYLFTIVSYLIGVFIFATIVGQVGNVITNRNANRLEFERLLDGAKTYMRHHKVPGGMKRRVLRWYDYSWSRGRIQGGGDINTALGLLPDKLKTELALHVNLSVLKKVTIFQECQPEFLHDLVLKMKAYIFTPGDSICRKGEVAREMFIIADGILEVLSETGKVLTTMKAGDFFGEIGILNLDGLNKRTADVRSVGYSELFSLSREDVLTAMKDYPEAQEILQTLGRKRLMEVRCVNKKHAKAATEKENQNQQKAHQQNQSCIPNDNTASKKIVNRIKSDVKSVLKKTRPSRRSNESLEMQPLHSTSPKNIKSTLKRMSRVKSDDERHDQEDALTPSAPKDKTPSPIGAGLPLLQRLKLLKEKQDREERVVKPTQPPQPQKTDPTPPNSHVTVSPQESIQEEPDKETSDGLPIMKRLHQLRIKTDNFPSDANTISTSSTKNIAEKLADILPNVNETKSSSARPGIIITQIKPSLKVSFLERIQALQSVDVSQKVSPKNEVSKQGTSTIISTLSNIIAKPSVPITKNKSCTSSLPLADSQLIKPWSKLKLATVISSSSYNSLTNSGEELESNENPKPLVVDNLQAKPGIKKNNIQPNTRQIEINEKLYKSVFDLSPEYRELPFVKRLKILNERQKLAELEKVLQIRSYSLDCSKTSYSLPDDSLYRSHSDATGIFSVPTFDKLSSSTSTNSDTSQIRLSQCLEYCPLSPESNETQERRQLKSILKKMQSADDSLTPMKHTTGLLKAHTLEGYVARHSKLAKSVTFNSTLSSPPKNSNELWGCFEDQSPSNTNRFQFPNSSHSLSSTGEDSRFVPNSSFNNENREPVDQSKSDDLQSINMKGILQSDEHFKQILIGINSVITTNMHEMQTKFANQFSMMEYEVRRRDKIIAELQSKIIQMELTETGKNKSAPLQENANSDSSEMSSTLVDSVDTILHPSQQLKIGSRLVAVPNSTKNNNPFLQETDKRTECTRDGSQLQFGMGLSKYTDNIVQLPDSVVLNIDKSFHSSTTSSSESNSDEESDVGYRQTNPVNSNNWEVQMLAAELDSRERKRGQSLTENLGDLNRCTNLLRRRRKLSDTDAESSETETCPSANVRPRSGSLDMFNLRYGTGVGICKTHTIDRNIDKL